MSETQRSGGSGSGGGGGGGAGERFVYSQLMGVNYTSWIIRVQAIMEDQGVWEVVEPSRVGEMVSEG
jgi:hypothetical protein